MRYFDSFVLPLPKTNLAAYKKMAKLAARVWMDHGALSYVECIADDVKPGKVTSFPQAVKAKQNEVVVVAFVTYKSRAQRDAVLRKVMKDPRLAAMMDTGASPFDVKRMFWGGFKGLVEV
jgi:uncharacterized protein YbaA (DUF1428 family)